MATAISSWVNVILLVIILLYKTWWAPDYDLIKTVIKIFFSSLLMIIFLILINNFIIQENLEYFNKISSLFILVLSGLLVYILFSKLFRVISLLELKSMTDRSL